MSNKYQLLELTTIKEMLPCFWLIQQLYPDMTKNKYKKLLKEMMKGGYRQVVVFKKDKAVGLSGYWINTKLYCEKYIEPDNVIVDKNHRSKGIGKLIGDWMAEKAEELKCKAIVLDAYVENKGAHRFYLREGFTIRGYHFVKYIE